MTPAERTNLIISEVAAAHHMTVKEMLSGDRTRRVAYAKQEAMYELRRRTTLSTPQIAAKLGLKDHGTIVVGSDAHAERNGIPRIRDLRKAEAA